jgi:hypothetical protein
LQSLLLTEEISAAFTSLDFLNALAALAERFPAYADTIAKLVLLAEQATTTSTVFLTMILSNHLYFYP